MRAEIKERWIDALLSGDYKQGTGRLRRQGDDDGPDEFCCLGVLCELAVKDGVVERRDPPTGVTCYSYGANDDEADSVVLPESVAAWVGLESLSATYTTNDSDGEGELTVDNDAGAKFEQIAEIIREKF